jgi:hypothetical protein
MFLMPDGVHVIGYGTSVAAADLGGTIALKLQSEPMLTPYEASIQRMYSASDAFTGPVPNDLWGWGKLRVPQAIAGVGSAGKNAVDFALASRNPASGSISFDLTLSSADLRGPASVTIVDLSGRQIATLGAKSQVGTQRLTWSGRASSGATVAAGVYWARFQSSSKSRTRSFVWLH